MSDAADKANDIAETERQRQVANMRKVRRASLVEDCEDCGEPIPKARREAMPSATMCIFCQELSEANTQR